MEVKRKEKKRKEKKRKTHSLILINSALLRAQYYLSQIGYLNISERSKRLLCCVYSILSLFYTPSSILIAFFLIFINYLTLSDPLIAEHIKNTVPWSFVRNKCILWNLKTFLQLENLNCKTKNIFSLYFFPDVSVSTLKTLMANSYDNMCQEDRF